MERPGPSKETPGLVHEDTLNPEAKAAAFRHVEAPVSAAAVSAAVV